jgi:hypothetical protein
MIKQIRIMRVGQVAFIGEMSDMYEIYVRYFVERAHLGNLDVKVRMAVNV